MSLDSEITQPNLDVYEESDRSMLRILVVDIPYYLRLKERNYSMEHETANLLFKPQHIYREKYIEEEPYDENNVPVIAPVASILEGGDEPLRYQLKNSDPVGKSYEYKYTRFKIVIFDPKRDLVSTEDLRSAINSFMENYIAFTSDNRVSKISEGDLMLVHELYNHPFSGGLGIALRVSEVRETEEAVRLTDESSEDFNSYLDKQPSDSGLFLHKARHMYANDFHSAAILYAEKSVECLIDRLMDEKIEGREEVLSHVNLDEPRKMKKKIQVLGILTGRKITHSPMYSQYAKLRKRHRNELIHASHEVNKDDAKEYLEKSLRFRDFLLINLQDEEELNISNLPEFEYIGGKKIDLDLADKSKLESKFDSLPKINWDKSGD